MPAPACTMLPSSALRYTAPSWPPKVSLHPVTLGGARWRPSLAHRRPKGSPVHFHPKDLTWNASTQQVLYDILKTLTKCHDFEVVEPQRQDTFCAAKIRQRLSGILSALAFCGGPVLVLSTLVSRDAQTRRKAPQECSAAGGPPQGPAGASIRTRSVLGLLLTQINQSPQNQTPLVPLLSLGTARSSGHLGARCSHPSCGWRLPLRSCPAANECPSHSLFSAACLACLLLSLGDSAV